MKVGEIMLGLFVLLFVASCQKADTKDLMLENYKVIENFTTAKHYFVFDAVNGEKDSKECFITLDLGNETYQNQTNYSAGDFLPAQRKSFKLIFTMPTGNSTMNLKASCNS